MKRYYRIVRVGDGLTPETAYRPAFADFLGYEYAVVTHIHERVWLVAVWGDADLHNDLAGRIGVRQIGEFIQAVRDRIRDRLESDDSEIRDRLETLAQRLGVSDFLQLLREQWTGRS